MKNFNVKNWIIAGCGGIFILCLAIGALGYSLQERPPQREPHVDIEELLIDESVLPMGWKTNLIGPPASAPLGGQTSIERISVDFHNGNNVMVEEIHRFTSLKKAEREFNHVKPLLFPTGEHWSPWEKPPGLNYQSPYAHRLHIACARETWEPNPAIEFCRLLGQYEVYIVRFSTHIVPSAMTYEDFELVVRSIDERLGNYLGTVPIIHNE